MQAHGNTSSALDVGHATDVGRVREANEDALLSMARTGGDGELLVAVADGMGGHKAGEVAAALAVESLKDTLGSTDDNRDNLDGQLEQAVELANRIIWQAAAEDIDKEGMGTTLVCAVVSPSGSLTIANVGDSRAYLVHGRSAELVTSDHTWVNQQVIDRQISEREARTSPYRNLLTRSLGNSPRVKVDLFTGRRLEPGEALVLVSDGVSGYLDAKDVAAILRASASAQEAAEELVNEAVNRGGADNATAVVVRRT
ncbi:MAG TPA: protein phosphatase 2C domain-containing protein [Chloroflexota bacterium]